jgi:hypothetical protein
MEAVEPLERGLFLDLAIAMGGSAGSISDMLEQQTM